VAIAAGNAAGRAEASDDFSAFMAGAAAFDDCTMENSIIAKPIIIIRTSLVVCIVSFYQVKFVLMLFFTGSRINKSPHIAIKNCLHFRENKERVPE
jgi:hypothetical protein